MVISQYQFAVVYLDGAGRVLSQHFLDVDWSPAIECVRWKGVREGILDPADLGGVPKVSPLPGSDSALPYVRGFRMTIRSACETPVALDFETDYFAGVASRAIQENGGGQSTARGEAPAAYRIAAFPAGREPAPPVKARFKVEEIAAPLPLSVGDLNEFLPRSESHGEHDRDDAPVFVPAAILQETTARTVDAGECETGGVLLGKVYRDSASNDVFLIVTAQLPAEHTRSTRTRLTFTHETWAAAQSALALRGKGEIMLGWWHTHLPRYWCKDCPTEKQELCPLARGFFSDADCKLHAAIFPRAHSLALVETYGEDVQHALFCWRNGLVQRRGFRILHTDCPDQFSCTAETIGGLSNAKP